MRPSTPAGEPPAPLPAPTRVTVGELVLEATPLEHARCPVCSRPVPSRDGAFACDICDTWFVVVRE